MSPVTALLDANVLYPAPVRDILMQLAVEDLFRAKWSADIHREWIEALLRQEPYRDRAALERTRLLMDTAVRDALVTSYEPLTACLEMPEVNDRHVLAAAIDSIGNSRKGRKVDKAGEHRTKGKRCRKREIKAKVV